MEAETALVGSAGIIVLDAVALEHAYIPIIHANRNSEMKFPHRPAQEFAYWGIEMQQVRNMIELLLGHIESI